MLLFKKLSLLILIFIYIVLGLILNFLSFFFSLRWRYGMISNWTRLICIFFCKVLRVRVKVEGNSLYLKERGNFIIANHQSYLDGIILASLFPVLFVSKLQVKSWPVFGWMTKIGGTVFIDRKRKLKSAVSLDKISQLLKNKVNILLFPEGTSTDGSKILAFQSIFFQTPLDADASIVPITLQYLKVNAQSISLLNRDAVCWYGQISFFQHLAKVIKLKNIEAKVKIHPKIKSSCSSSQPDFRKTLSETARQVILKDFSFIK